MIVVVFFFFKQKTAYEMRISDWSSDVCSSDLRDQEQHDSAGDTETVEADAERVEDIVPEQREDDQDQRRDADGAQRHRACVRRARPRRQPGIDRRAARRIDRSEEHTSELQSLMRISYAVFCLKKKKKKIKAKRKKQNKIKQIVKRVLKKYDTPQINIKEQEKKHNR